MDWNAIRESLRGPGALVPSVFEQDFELNAVAVERNIRWMMEHGFGSDGDGFFFAPCADGEYATLNAHEIGEIVSAVSRGSDAKLPIVAGVHSADIREAIRMGQAARDAGAVAVMLAPPSYYTLNSEAIVDWYKRFAEAVDIGIMIYEQSYRGPVVNAVISPDLVGQLLEIPAVVAMKHIGIFNLIDGSAILQRYADKIAYIDTSGGLTTTAGYIHGATGYVSEMPCFWPELETRYWEHLKAGEFVDAEKWRSQIWPLIHFFQDNPSTNSAVSWVTILKVCLEYVGLEHGSVRPPFRVLNAEEKRPLIDVLDKIGVPRGKIS